jgi:hypothetical protein
MKTKLLFSVIVAVALSLADQAGASLFDITYSGGGISGSGEITATPNGNGSYTAIGGTFTVSSGPYAGAAATVVPLTAPWGPQVGFSGNVFLAYGGTDLFPVDNLVYPGQTSLLTQGGSSFAGNNGGLAFNDPNFVGPGGKGLAFVIYANAGGPGGYGIIFNGVNNQPYAAEYDGGTVTLNAVPVPEPTTLMACLLMVLPFGASALRILRRKA